MWSLSYWPTNRSIPRSLWNSKMGLNHIPYLTTFLMIITMNSSEAKRDGENDVSRDTFLLRNNLHREERNTSVFCTCSLSLYCNEKVFTNACSLSSFRVWKCCLQVEHSRTDPRVWTCLCLMRPSAYMKDFSHWLHWCLFTPEWLQWGKEISLLHSLTIL